MLNINKRIKKGNRKRREKDMETYQTKNVSIKRQYGSELHKNFPEDFKKNIIKQEKRLFGVLC